MSVLAPLPTACARPNASYSYSPDCSVVRLVIDHRNTLPRPSSREIMCASADFPEPGRPVTINGLRIGRVRNGFTTDPAPSFRLVQRRDWQVVSGGEGPPRRGCRPSPVPVGQFQRVPGSPRQTPLRRRGRRITGANTPTGGLIGMSSPIGHQPFLSEVPEIVSRRPTVAQSPSPGDLVLRRRTVVRHVATRPHVLAAGPMPHLPPLSLRPSGT